MTDYQNTYQDNFSMSDTEKKKKKKKHTKWSEFKANLNKMTKNYVPTKFYKPKDSHPGVTCQIKRLINKKYRLYAKLKQNRSNTNIKATFKF